MVVVHTTADAKIKGSNPVVDWNQETFYDVPSSDGIKFFFCQCQRWQHGGSTLNC